MPNNLSLALLNGQIIPLEQAQISLAHPVFSTSFGVYEAIQIDRGRPFHLRPHLERLGISANIIGVNLPQIETLLDWAALLISDLPAETFTLQILVVGQTSSAKMSLVTMFPRPTPSYPAACFEAGAQAITFNGQRTLPQCKSFNTLVNHLARAAARCANAIESILAHQNHFYEGARSNLFVVEAKTNRLMTPPAEQVLPGITRDIVIQLMQQTSSPVQQIEIPFETAVSEMFLTSTSMHVLPITMLNGRPIGAGQIGPVTREAMSKFEEYYAKLLPIGGRLK